MQETSQELRYFAYGSNLHPVRMSDRVPSARALGVLELRGWSLRFHKRGRDGSGKCNVIREATTDAVVQGVVYAIDPRDKPALDRAEGLGIGYELSWHQCPIHGSVFFYTAREDHVDDALQPYTWYWRFVVEGARLQGLSEPYLNVLHAVAHIADIEPARHAENLRILERQALPGTVRSVDVRSCPADASERGGLPGRSSA
ncbi:MAG: gamma-glutamylcyclotransferase [Gammaproteobacteria bacterium]|nr:gamma-glutamylcyclotransferase [Gammaproteobacteria bacterium]